MTEYLELGHLEHVDNIGVNKHPMYYLPHHPVFKESSTSTKMRVIFDGSAASSSGISLNDVLLKGPKVQPDIFNILIRFRLHQVAITADVAKMYRQVLVTLDDCDPQCIVYRKSPTEQLQHYLLCTVKYGTKSASFLATRYFVEIGNSSNDLMLKRVISEDFYVDDLISDGSSDNECLNLYKNLFTLNSAGFPLRKWCSSSIQFMSQIPVMQEDPNFTVKLHETETISALGLFWQPAVDHFRFAIKKWNPLLIMTKRSLLSDIISVYDPTGITSHFLKVFS